MFDLHLIVGESRLSTRERFHLFAIATAAGEIRFSSAVANSCPPRASGCFITTKSGNNTDLLPTSISLARSFAPRRVKHCVLTGERVLSAASNARGKRTQP